MRRGGALRKIDFLRRHESLQGEGAGKEQGIEGAKEEAENARHTQWTKIVPALGESIIKQISPKNMVELFLQVLLIFISCEKKIIITPSPPFYDA